MMKYFLFSGGLDVTAYLIKLLYTTDEVFQPIYIVRKHSGKSKGEWEATTTIVNKLLKMFPKRIKKPIREIHLLYQLFSKEEVRAHRNKMLIEYVRDKYEITSLYTGILLSDSVSPPDSDPEILSEETNVEIIISGWKTKLDALKEIKELISKEDLKKIEDVLLTSYSCQQHFECGRCYSCVKRAVSMQKVFKTSYKKHGFKYPPESGSKFVQYYLSLDDSLEAKKELFLLSKKFFRYPKIIKKLKKIGEELLQHEMITEKKYDEIIKNV